MTCYRISASSSSSFSSSSDRDHDTTIVSPELYEGTTFLVFPSSDFEGLADPGSDLEVFTGILILEICAVATTSGDFSDASVTESVDKVITSSPELLN